MEKITANTKVWMHLEMPMILLAIKMSLEYLYKNHYFLFFDATDKYAGEVKSFSHILDCTGQDVLFGRETV
jgi:hypothetical protein